MRLGISAYNGGVSDLALDRFGKVACTHPSRATRSSTGYSTMTGGGLAISF